MLRIVGKEALMKILVYGINYAPEKTGIGKYTAELCTMLAKSSKSVDVITAMPYYPEWKVNESYSKKLWHTQYINGVRVFRNPLYVPKKVTGTSRILQDLSFFISSGIQWFKAMFRKYDVIFCVYPPLPIGIYPLIYRLFHRTPVWLHIQDLQVDAARNFRIIRNKRVIKILECIERMLLRQVDLISTISDGMKNKIILKGINPDKIKILPNWAEIKNFSCDPIKRSALKQDLGFRPESKLVLYSGNIGEKQGLDLVVDVAKSFELEEPNVHFLIVGEGAYKKKLEARVIEAKVSNISFRSFVEPDRLPDLLNAADVHLVLQKKGACSLVLPSKLANILACGGIAIVSTDPGSSLDVLLKSNRAAYLCLPENQPSFAKSLKAAIGNSDGLIPDEIRTFAFHQFDKESIFGKFDRTFFEICSGDYPHNRIDRELEDVVNTYLQEVKPDNEFTIRKKRMESQINAQYKHIEPHRLISSKSTP